MLITHKRENMTMKTVCFIAVLITQAYAGNVLYLNLPIGAGRMIIAQKIAKNLYEQYGHKTTMLTNDRLLEQTEDGSPYVDFIFAKGYENFHLNRKVNSYLNKICSNQNVAYTTYRTLIDNSLLLCKSLILDEELRKKLMNKSFEIAIIDSTAGCFNLFVHVLSIPRITVGRAFPHITSAVTEHSLINCGTQFPFFQRLISATQAMTSSARTYPLDSITHLIDKIPGVSPISAEELYASLDFMLINSEPILDFPALTLPNAALVGGLCTGEKSNIDEQLQKFMDSNTDGVIVVSFGSIAKSLPEIQINHFIEAFKQFPLLKFVFKNGESVLLDDNILMLPWMPQNELLSHPNTKAFITHCGSNGQYEALYHAVPMIGIPLFAEQHDNAQKMQSRGLGITLDFCILNATTVVRAIKTILNGEYKKVIAKASAAFRSHPMSPSERAAFWVNYVIVHGSSYLRCPYRPFNQHNMMTVLVSVLFIFMISLLCVWYQCFRCSYYRKRKQN